MHSLLVPIIAVFLHFYLVEAGPGPSPSLVPPSSFGELSSTSSSFSSVTVSSEPASGSSVVSATPTASAQFPSLSGVSSCVSNCLQIAVSSNCSSVTDVNCYCNSQRFTQQIVDCTSRSCPGELTTLESLAQQFCNLASQPASLSFPSLTTTSISSLTSPPLNSTAVSSTSSTSSTIIPASASSSNAAAFSIVYPWSAYLEPSTLLPAVVVMFGVAFGALLVG